MQGARGDRPARIRVKARGEDLPVQGVTTLAAPLRVQLLSDAGPCWEARYSEPFDNAAPGRLRDRSD
jgi:hypothetical protein